MLKTTIATAVSAVFFGCAAQAATYDLYFGDYDPVGGYLSINDADNNGVLTASEVTFVDAMYTNNPGGPSGFETYDLWVENFSLKVQSHLGNGDMQIGTFGTDFLNLGFRYEYATPTCANDWQTGCVLPGEEDGSTTVIIGYISAYGDYFLIRSDDDPLPAVPLPASAALIVSGLAAFGALRRRKSGDL